MLFRKGKGYLKLYERQKFPSKAWFRHMVKGFGRKWLIDTVGHMGFGAVMGTIVAILSKIFFGVTTEQFLGISGISIAMDLTVNGRAETLFVNALHNKWSRVRPI